MIGAPLESRRNVSVSPVCVCMYMCVQAVSVCECPSEHLYSHILIGTHYTLHVLLHTHTHRDNLSLFEVCCQVLHTDRECPTGISVRDTTGHHPIALCHHLSQRDTYDNPHNNSHLNCCLYNVLGAASTMLIFGGKVEGENL